MSVISLRTWLLLLLLVERQKRHSRDLNTLESNSGNITHGMTGTTEPSHKDLVVLIHIVQTTIAGNECGNFLPVLNELDTDTLSDGGVGLFGLNTNLFEDNALGHGGSSHGIGLVGGDGVGLAVNFIVPTLVTPVDAELAPSSDTGWLSHVSIMMSCDVM